VSTASALRRGRRAAKREMRDHITFRRSTGDKTFDPQTRKNTPARVIVYTGPCRVQSQPTVAHETEAGEHAGTVKGYVVSLPITAVGIEVGDVGTVDDVDDVTGDPDLLGRKLRVTDVLAKTSLTARRLACEETTS
jgi:hypothetical protein